MPFVASSRSKPLPIALLALSLLAGSARAEDFAGRARVVDGDTLSLEGRSLKLRSIDAPELGQLCERSGYKYDCGRQASWELAKIIDRNEVVCSGTSRDRYGRPLVVCIVDKKDSLSDPEPFDIGAELVRLGWAVACGPDYQAQQDEAQGARRGLWEGTFQTPAEWRKQHSR